MTFNHTTYKHEKGLRSRPRNALRMSILLESLETAISDSAATRERHRGKDLPGRARELQIERATLEGIMPAVRQEQARNSKDPARKRRYGAELTYLSKRARAEKRLLMRMLGEWK